MRELSFGASVHHIGNPSMQYAGIGQLPRCIADARTTKFTEPDEASRLGDVEASRMGDTAAWRVDGSFVSYRRLVSVTPAITIAPPISIEARIDSPSNSAASVTPKTGTRLLNTAVRAGPIFLTPS